MARPSVEKENTRPFVVCVCVCVCLWRLEKQIFSFLSTKRVQENVCVCRLFFFLSVDLSMCRPWIKVSTVGLSLTLLFLCQCR